MNKVKIAINVIPVNDTDPRIGVYQVTLSNEDGVWEEPIPTRELLESFIRGLKAASSFAGREIEIPEIPPLTVA